ncbi:hypothetical protein QQS21_009853 [Conoideocrella luteorostrata]|uniref:RTA1 domain protein n=1 Tax=Conoideocrella luteorostrata TaxID=1105319 RepID=A0AAJ0FPZ2_9HYPO|nr:hypothetical protein QQS21_009853 [Conoideocrella luteorostrata]
MSKLAHCTRVTPDCPIQATTYGYYPSFAPNTLLLCLFAICAVGQIVLCILTRVYAYSIAIGIGATMEAVGYAGRLMMHDNPYSGAGFKANVICLLIAPSFIAGGIYLTMKHYILSHAPEFSLLKPALYTWIFIGCDILSILLQAIGGGFASGADPEDRKRRDLGNNIMVGGIVFQVVTMVFCGALVVAYMYRKWRHERHGSAVEKIPDVAAGAPWKIRAFRYMVVLAYLTVLVRCIYRIPEMVGGWGNELMRKETDFLVLDGMMVVIATVGLTVTHPGYFFPAMRTNSKNPILELSRR